MSPPRRSSSAPGERDLESYRDISDDVIESDFVPYACLYDPDTLATKNGELLQIIRITGLGFDAQSQGDLRSNIRAAIRQCIPDTTYAIWLHTLRRRQSLLSAAKFPDRFSADIDEAWRAQHPASASFVNELYVTVVKAAQQANLSSMEAMRQSLWPPNDRAQRTAYLDNALKELTLTTGNIIKTLGAFGARKLTTVERNGVCYGEHIEFIEKLINLEERPMEIPRRDLSIVLTSGEITFGYNAMEVRTAEGHRRFACILSLKEYKESTLPGIDKFLEIPCELIVTQCFDYVGGEKARAAYETQARYLSISGDTELAKWVEIDRLTSASNTAKTFGEQQTSIFLIAPSMKQLEANVRMTQKALARIGMVVVREDLRFEECYWAQLPSNFPFVIRKHSVDAGHLAGFANLQRQPMGNAAGSDWGPPVSLLPSVQDTPYFFNFQRNVGGAVNGHTIITGPKGSGRTTFTHFLLSQARKLNMNICYIDTHGRAGDFINAMGGQYVTPGTAQLRLNPFGLSASRPNQEFLGLWLSTLIDPYGHQLSHASLSFFQSLIDQLFKLPPSQRRLSALLPIVREADAMLASGLQRWCAGGEFGELFDMPADQFSMGPLTAWNLAPWAKTDATLLPLAGYLLHRLTSSLTGTPTMIVLDEGFSLLRTPLFGPRTGPWLDFLAQNNAAVMFSTSDIPGSAVHPFTPVVAQKAASIFALPDNESPADYAMGFAFREGELGALAHMDRAAHQVLLKRGDEATLLKVQLAPLGPQNLAILAGQKTATKSPEETLRELMGHAPAAAGALS